MSYRNRRPMRRMLTIVIVLGILVGIFYEWGDDILYFATGQDILDDLHLDLAARTRPTPTPVVGALAASGQAPDGDQAGDVSGEVVLAADGFPLRPRQHVIKYTIQPGDSLFQVADRFNIHPNTIFWANTETLHDNVHLIHAGMDLYILPVNGVYHLSDGASSIAEIAAFYGVTPGDILYSEYNALALFDSAYVPPAGLRIVVPGGRRDYVSWQAPIRTGTESGRTNPEGTLHPGSCRQIYTGTGGLGQYANPLGTQSYRVTTGFVPWHPGIDLAADRNTPIYAAEAGVVVFAGWHRDGYGRLVIIDHGEGWTTYYGHLETLFVGCGDQVTKGQYIAEMGMSGNATGIHLHFEIRQNDRPQDPREYIEIRGTNQPGG